MVNLPVLLEVTFSITSQGFSQYVLSSLYIASPVTSFSPDRVSFTTSDLTLFATPVKQYFTSQGDVLSLSG